MARIIKKYQEYKKIYEMNTRDIENLPRIKTWEDVKYYERAAMEKIRNAINFIIAKHPVYSLPILEFGVNLHWHLPSKTAATDYSNIYFDPKFAMQLTNEELRFVLLHECLHIIYAHNIRLKGRDRLKWNQAADYAINDLLVLDPLTRDNKISLPRLDGEVFILHDLKYRGLSAEQIYDIIPTKKRSDDGQQQGQQQDGQQDGQTIHKELQDIIDSQDKKMTDEDLAADEIDNSQAKNIKKGKYDKGEKPSEESMKSLKNEMRDRVAGNGEFLGKSLQGHLLNSMTEPSTIDWKQMLKKYIRGMFKSKNYVDSKRIYRAHKLNVQGSEKSRAKTVIKNLIIAVDVSASINIEQIKKFINEVNNILNTYIVKKTTIYYVDTKIKEKNIDVFGRHGTPDFSKAVEGGGTDFHPPFQRLKEDNIIPDIFVYFTDGESAFPSRNFADISKYENRIFWCVVNDKNYFDSLEPGYGHLIHINYSSI